MHKFLQSNGFHKIISEKEWNKILHMAEDEFTEYDRIALEEGLDFCELRKECGIDIGICSYGQVDENEKYAREYYLPYLKGSGITTYADVIVERRSDVEAYIGICEDVKIGSTLIFHLLNGIEYMVESDRGLYVKNSTSVTLSGLANYGTVLMPIMKNMKLEEERKEEYLNRNRLLNAARSGDTDAIESLTLEDIDTYTEVSERLKSEDIYTIVDTYFMPYGAECDKYAILGEITNMRIVENVIVKECVYILTLNVNELEFDVCVPVDCVIGEPEIGRRFKTDIWLQGYINF